MKRFDANIMRHWHKPRKAALLEWMTEQGFSPGQAASLTLEDDGTFNVELFLLSEDGKRQIDPDNPNQALTVVVNFTPTKPCPEAISTD